MEMPLPPEGEVLATHPAKLLNRIAAVVFLMVPGALAIFAGTQVRAGDAMVGPLLMIGGGLVLALGALAIAQQNKSRVIVRTDGIERWGLRGKIWALRWADMTQLHYRVVKVRMGGLLGLLLPALSTNVHLAVTDPNGKKKRLPYNLKAMEMLAERVTEEHATAQFAPARSRIDAGEEVRFGKLIALDREKISARKFFGGMKSCPLGEIEKVSVEGGALRIRRKGKTLAFARIMAGSIPNVFVLLRLLDGMVEKRSKLPQDRDFAATAYVHG